MAQYFLLDLERTIQTGEAWFWKSNKHGYTTSLMDAGLYAKEVAQEIVRTDFDQTTVMIPLHVVRRVIGLDMSKRFIKLDKES